jgi:hypothetical protein
MSYSPACCIEAALLACQANEMLAIVGLTFEEVLTVTTRDIQPRRTAAVALHRRGAGAAAGKSVVDDQFIAGAER